MQNNHHNKFNEVKDFWKEQDKSIDKLNLRNTHDISPKRGKGVSPRPTSRTPPPDLKKLELREDHKEKWYTKILSPRKARPKEEIEKENKKTTLKHKEKSSNSEDLEINPIKVKKRGGKKTLSENVEEDARKINLYLENEREREKEMKRKEHKRKKRTVSPRRIPEQETKSEEQLLWTSLIKTTESKEKLETSEIRPPERQSILISRNLHMMNTSVQLNSSNEKTQQNTPTQKQEDLIAKLFISADKDQDGLIKPLDLRTCIQSAGMKLNNHNCDLLFRRADTKLKGFLTFSEFRRILWILLEVQRLILTVNTKDGKMNRKQFKLFLEKNFQLDLSDKLVRYIIKLFDEDDSKNIEFQELFNFIFFLQEIRYQYCRIIEEPIQHPIIFEELFGSQWNSKKVQIQIQEFLRFYGLSSQSSIILNQPKLKLENFIEFVFQIEYIPALESSKNQKKETTTTTKTVEDEKSNQNENKNITPHVVQVRRYRKKAPQRKIPQLKKSISQVSSEFSTLILQNLQKSLKFTQQQKWVDEEFEPNISLLPKRSSSHSVVWNRPTVWCESPSLFVNGTEAGDVIQGSLGDCWFLSALAILASAEGLIEELFVSSDPERGMYQCKFFKNGEWVVVAVDDRIPCHESSNKPLFASCSEKNEFWVPILEKAYAKLHGSYAAIESGSSSDALRDLTGEPVEVIGLDSLELNNPKNVDLLWERLLHYHKESYLMGCAFASESAEPEEETQYGILLNHAYSILDLSSYEGHRLLRIRNPWGKYEWIGAWSDNSSEWTPELQKYFNFEFADDGTFFMCIEDFVLHYNRIHVLRMMTDDIGKKWEKNSFDLEWDEKSSGGCLLYPTWSKNPQISLISKHPNLTAPNTIFVGLSQPDSRYNPLQKSIGRGSRKPYPPIGIHILKGDPSLDYKKVSFSPEDRVVTSVFSSTRDVSVEFKADRDVQYYIVPCTYEPGIISPLNITIYSEEPLENVFSLTKEKPSLSVKGSWDQTTSGGCSNHITFINNPQFTIEVEEETDVTIFLDQFSNDGEDIYYAGFYIFIDNSGSGKRLYDFRNMVLQTRFTNIRRTNETLHLSPEFIYVIVPCTFEPNLMRDFQLSVVSSSIKNIQLFPVEEWISRVVTSKWSIKKNQAGGCRNHSTWKNNPRILIIVSSPLTEPSDDDSLKMNIVLARHNPNFQQGIGFYLFYVPEKDMALSNDFSSLKLLGTSKFSNSPLITESFIFQQPSHGKNHLYLVLPATYENDIEAPFKLEILSSHENVSVECLN